MRIAFPKEFKSILISWPLPFIYTKYKRVADKEIIFASKYKINSSFIKFGRSIKS